MSCASAPCPCSCASNLPLSVALATSNNKRSRPRMKQEDIPAISQLPQDDMWSSVPSLDSSHMELFHDWSLSDTTSPEEFDPDATKDMQSMYSGLATPPSTSPATASSSPRSTPPATSLASFEPPAKRRKVDKEKEYKYQLVQAFFRVYFRPDPLQSLPKEDVFTLYSTVISPGHQLAKNAVYRYMWTFYKSVSVIPIQINHRECVKGLAFVNPSVQPNLYPTYMEDVLLLQKEASDHHIVVGPFSNSNSNPTPVVPVSGDVKTTDEIVLKINRLEYAAQLIVSELGGLKQELRNRGFYV